MTDHDENTRGRHNGDDHTNDVDTDDLSGAYVLNALSDDERHAFEALMEESDEIRTEVTGLNETALLLGRGVEPVMPSTGLRASILDRIATTPQLAALSAPASLEADDTEHELAPGRTAVPEMEPSETQLGRVLSPTGSARARWFTRPAAVLGAAAAAAALFFGGGAVISAVTDTQQQQQQASGIDEIYAASDFQRTVADVSTGGKATLVWSNDLGRSAVVVDGMTSLPGDKTYELWYINDDGAVPAGTFDAASDAPATHVLKGEMQAGDTVGITVEPSGGSSTPTTDPVVAIPSA